MKLLRPPLYLYFPLFVFLLYFAIDKICSLDAYKRLTMDDAPFLIFEYKETLLDNLGSSFAEAHPKEGEGADSPRKLALVLGTSRLLFLNYDHFQANYPDWEVFNFSGPVTYPAYYLYILERALEKGARPELLIVEAAPFQYSDGTDAFSRSNLAYSFDLRFVWKHFSRLKRDEVSYFLARYLFSAYRYPPKWKNIQARLSNPDNKTLKVFELMEEFQRTHNGSARNIIPKEDWFQNDYATMQYQAEHKTIPWLYRNFRLSDRQFAFTEELLRLSQKYGIRVFLINPAVSSPLRHALKKRHEIQAELLEYEKRMDGLARKYRALRIDYNNHPDYQCNTFVDDAHMAVTCYNLMADDIMQQLRQLEQPSRP